MLVLFYGIDAAFRILAKRLGTSRASRQLNGVVADLAKELGVSEEKIRQTLHERYTKSKLRRLMETAVGFGSPSKGEDNAPILIGGRRRLEREDVAEIPAVAQPSEEEADRSDPHENVEIELHAQDIDRAKAGWAGVPKGLTENRLRMELYPPISPDEIWGNPSLTRNSSRPAQKSYFADWVRCAQSSAVTAVARSLAAVFPSDVRMEV